MSKGFAAQVTQPIELYNEDLKKRNISETAAKALQLEFLDAQQTRDLVGGRLQASIKIPYFNLNHETYGFSRVRYLGSLPLGSEGKPMNKYSQQKGSGSHVYFIPTVNWQLVTKDVNIPIIITEGEFKTWAIYKAIQDEQLAHAPIGLAGVSMWTAGKAQPNVPLHPELRQFQWQAKRGLNKVSRQVYIIFDYDGNKDDGELRDEVAFEESKLAITLKGLGAEVHLCRVGKFAPIKEKYAVDDHLLNEGKLAEVLVSVSQENIINQNTDTKLREFGLEYAEYKGSVLELATGDIYPLHKAKVRTAHRTIMVMRGTGANQRPTDVPLLDAYLKWPRRTEIKEIGMYPQYGGIKITPEGHYNMFDGWAHEPIEGDVSAWLDYCKYFFKDQTDYEEFFHNWVAQIVQKPWEKNNTTVQFLSSEHGKGKSVILGSIAEMLGKDYDHSPAIILQGNTQLESRFNKPLEGKIYAFFDEPSIEDRHVADKLKSMITSNDITIEKKGLDAYNTRNYINFAFATNRTFVTAMDKDSRREAIYDAQTQDRQQIIKMSDKLNRWKKDSQGLNKMLYWYYMRDITEFNRFVAPDTAQKREAIENSRSPVEQFASWLITWSQNNVGEIAFFSDHQLREMYRLEDGKMVEAVYIKRRLKEAGSGGPESVTYEKRTIRGYRVGTAEAWKDASKVEIFKKTNAAYEAYVLEVTGQNLALANSRF